MENEGNEESSGRDELWRQYEVQADLYKFHLKIALQSNVAFYAITGSIVSFYFANFEKSSSLRLSLFVPLLTALAMLAICGYGSSLLEGTAHDLSEIQGQLGLRNVPEVKVLTLTLRLSAAVYLASAIGLLVLLLLPIEESSVFEAPTSSTKPLETAIVAE